MNAVLRKFHRWLSLTMLAFWFLQAATGAVMAFRWELDDALVAGPAAPLDPRAIAATIARIERERTGWRTNLVYPSGGLPGRFDIYLVNERGQTDIVRVDGAGTVLRSRPFDHDFARAPVVSTAAFLHQTLFAGDAGKRFIAISGLLLLTNLAFGLKLAWPRVGQWRLALVPRPARSVAATLYSWHRALGLWLAAPALVLVSCGVMLALEEPLTSWLGQDAEPPALESAPRVTGTPVDFAGAVSAALARYPGAAFSGMSLASADRPWHRVRVKQPAEWRRVYGTTVVWVSAADGTVLATRDALAAPRAGKFLDLLYPVHTGEAWGLPGRLLTLSVGCWLLTMLSLGLTLWWKRRRR